jgi:hypothetical protein
MSDASPSEASIPEILRSRLQKSEVASEPPAHDQIAQRAYEIASERGFIPGQELDDWLRAERELQASRAHASRTTF